MKLWTVVLKTVARVNTLGEYPYAVRAPDKGAAITEALAAHKVKHPTTSVMRVKEVVLWGPPVYD